MRIGTRLYVGFGGIIFVLLGMFLISQLSLERMANDQKNLQTSSYFYNQIAQVDSMIEKMQRYIILYANTGMKSIFDSVITLSLELEQKLISINKLSNDKLQQQMVKSMQQSLNLLSEQFKRASEDRYLRDDLLNGQAMELIAVIANDFKALRLITLSNKQTQQLMFSEMSVIRAQQSMLLYVTDPDSIRSKASKRHLVLAIRQLEDVESQLQTTEQRELVSKILLNMNNYKKQISKIFRLTRGYLFIFNGVIAGQAAEFSRNSRELKKLSLTQRNQLFDKLNRAINEFSARLTIATGISVILGIFFAWYTARGIVRPLYQITSTLMALSQGKSVDKIPGLQHKNEIGDMAKSAQVFKEKNNQTELLLQEAKKTQSVLFNNKEELKRHKENLEDMVRRRTQALEESVVTLNSAQIQLSKSERMASIGNMVQGVAHELNTPVGLALTGATHIYDDSKALSEDLANDELTKESLIRFLSVTSQLADSMTTSLERAAQLIKSFKLVSVNEHQEHLQKFNLREHLNNLLASMRRSIDGKYHIFNKIDDDIVITSYPGVFYQVYTNLMNNSVLHGFEGKDEGTITISATIDEAQLVLTYSDNGVGMSKDTMANIFDAFFTTKRARGGTGLGMSIVQALINDKLQGEIDLESVLNEGTTYKLIIPIINQSTLVNTAQHYSPVSKE